MISAGRNACGKFFFAGNIVCSNDISFGNNISLSNGISFGKNIVFSNDIAFRKIFSKGSKI